MEEDKILDGIEHDLEKLPGSLKRLREDIDSNGLPLEPRSTLIKLFKETFDLGFSLDLTRDKRFTVEYDGESKWVRRTVKKAKEVEELKSEKVEELKETLLDEFEGLDESRFLTTKLVFQPTYEMKYSRIDTEEDFKDIVQNVMDAVAEAKEESDEIRARKEELVSGYTEEIEDTELYGEYLEEKETLEHELDEIKEEEREKFEKQVEQKRKRQEKEKALEEEHVRVEQFEASYTDRDRKVLDFDFEDGKIVFHEPVNEQEGNCPVNRGDIWVSDVDHERELIEVKAEFVELRFWKKQRDTRIYLVGVGKDGFFVQDKLNREYGLMTVSSFLEYMEPGEVTRAREDGRETRRYGQMFFKEMKRKDNMDALDGTKYEAEKEGDTWTVSHPALEDVELKGLWKAVKPNGQMVH